MFNPRRRWPLAVLFWSLWTHSANTVLVWRLSSHCVSPDPPWATHGIDVTLVTTGGEQPPPCPSLFPSVSGEEPDVKGDYSVTFVFNPTCRPLWDTWARPRRKSQNSVRPPCSSYSRERIGTSHEGLFWADKIIMWKDPTREPLGAAIIMPLAFCTEQNTFLGKNVLLASWVGNCFWTQSGLVTGPWLSHF